MPAKEAKTAKELALLALEIVRRMQACGHVEAVKVSPDDHEGWIISGSSPGRADNSDVARAIVVAHVDLVERYELAPGDDSTG
jgi:hypothetical protein